QPADHDLVRPRQRFETRGEIRRLAGDGSCLPTAGTLDISDDDGAGSDPDMYLERQFLRRGDRRKAGTDRLCCLVFFSARPAEIGEDAIAEIIGDIAAV